MPGLRPSFEITLYHDGVIPFGALRLMARTSKHASLVSVPRTPYCCTRSGALYDYASLMLPSTRTSRTLSFVQDHHRYDLLFSGDLSHTVSVAFSIANTLTSSFDILTWKRRAPKNNRSSSNRRRYKSRKQFWDREHFANRSFVGPEISNKKIRGLQ